jgi:hypothetical protein
VGHVCVKTKRTSHAVGCARPCSPSAPPVSLCEPSAPDDQVAASFMEEEDARRSDVSGRMADTSTHGECEGGGGGGGGPELDDQMVIKRKTGELGVVLKWDGVGDGGGAAEEPE